MKIALNLMMCILATIVVIEASKVAEGKPFAERASTCRLETIYFGGGSWLPRCSGDCDPATESCKMTGGISYASCDCNNHTPYGIDCYGLLEEFSALTCTNLNCGGECPENNHNNDISYETACPCN